MRTSFTDRCHDTLGRSLVARDAIVVGLLRDIVRELRVLARAVSISVLIEEVFF